jgi:hypothetical protein
MHMHAPQTHARHEKSTCTWCHFFSMKMAHCPTCTEATAGSLLAWPCDASWRLQRLHGSTRLAAASQAAIAAVPRPRPPRTLHLRLLPTAVREARTGALAAATGHPGGQAAASAAAHAAVIEPAAFAALPAALAAASAAGAASRGLHTEHTERAETMHQRPKCGSERWKWTPEGGQGWDGGGGCGRAREGGVEAHRSSKNRVRGVARAENWPAYRDRGGRRKRRLRCHCSSHRRLIRRCRRRTRCLQHPRCSRRLSSRPSCRNGCPSRVRRPAQRAHS